MKKFTLENLTKDRACDEGLAFVTPIIEAGQSVPQALKDAGHVNWISWAIENEYDLSEIRSENFFWDDNGYITATAGYAGTATVGNCGTAIAGDYGTAIAGYEGKAMAGYAGIAIAGDYGTAIAGYEGKAMAGYAGIAVSGERGTSITSMYGTAIAGDYGTAIAGYLGTATAGEGGIIQIKYYKDDRYRIATGYIGENGLKPNTPYRVVDIKGNFHEVTEPFA